jgi:hypothetical protein
MPTVASKKLNSIGEGDAWPFEGAIVPGYPDLDPRQDDYWERFWKIYYGKLLAA